MSSPSAFADKMISAHATCAGISPRDVMLAALRTTAGNIRSLGPAGAIPSGVYRPWLEVVEAAIRFAEGKTQKELEAELGEVQKDAEKIRRAFSKYK